jgi:hypothetical protein
MRIRAEWNDEIASTRPVISVPCAQRTGTRPFSNIVAEFRSVSRFARKSRNTRDSFDGDLDELLVTNLIEISAMTKFDSIEGCAFNPITKTETVKGWEFEIDRFTWKYLKSQEVSNRLRSHGAPQKKQTRRPRNNNLSPAGKVINRKLLSIQASWDRWWVDTTMKC